MIRIYFHSSDLDGHCSGAIVKFRYPEAELFGINYGQPFPFDKIDKDDMIFMVDFSIEPFDEMLKLAGIIGLHKFIWIDHHKTAIAKANEAILTTDKGFSASFNEICPGKRVDGTAACILTWRELFPEIPLPMAVIHLGDYDVWHLENPDTLRFQYGFRLNDSWPENQNVWRPFFNPDLDNEFVEKTIRDGNTIVKYQKQENQKYCKSCCFELEFGGFKAIAINRLLTNSQMFDSVWDNTKYDIMITFGLRKDGRWTMSFYTDKPGVDVSDLAKIFGGGGHMQAAGCDFRSLPEELTWQIRCLQPAKFSDIPDYGDHFTIEDFIDSVKSGMFVDFDGSGYYATKDKMTDIYANPSEIYRDKIDKRWTHVMWFNK